MPGMGEHLAVFEQIEERNPTVEDLSHPAWQWDEQALKSTNQRMEDLAINALLAQLHQPELLSTGPAEKPLPAGIPSQQGIELLEGAAVNSLLQTAMGIEAWGRHPSGHLRIPTADGPDGVTVHGARMLRALYPRQRGQRHRRCPLAFAPRPASRMALAAVRRGSWAE